MTEAVQLAILILDKIRMSLAYHTLAHLAPVVQTLDSAVYRIKIYPVDSAIGFPNTYPLESDLSGG